MLFQLIWTKEFLRAYNKFPNQVQEIFKKKVLRLMQEPNIGKQLDSRLWELRHKKFRIYYEVVEDIRLILLIDVSEKKDQNKTIINSRIKSEDFRREINKFI